MLDDRTMHRYEHGKVRTREISQNHRENYQKNTNSDIFFSKDEKIREDKTPVKHQRTNSFVPKFTEKSALERKLIEFHNAGDISTTYETNANNSFDITQLAQRRKGSAMDLKSEYSTLNPKQRRIKELYPNMKQGDIDKYTATEHNVTFDEKKHFDGANAKEAVISDMYSNIFNDPKKSATKYMKQVKLPEKKKVQLTKHKNVPKSQTGTRIDWLEENTELMFKENLKTEVDTTPQRKKIRNIYGSSDRKDYVGNPNYKSNLDDQNNASKKMSEVKKMLQDKFGANHKYYSFSRLDLTRLLKLSEGSIKMISMKT